VIDLENNTPVLGIVVLDIEAKRENGSLVNSAKTGDAMGS
jgi:hypothetical protein